MSLYTSARELLKRHKHNLLIATSVAAFIGFLALLRLFVNWWVGTALDKQPDEPESPPATPPVLPPSFRTPEQQAIHDEMIRIKMRVTDESLQPGAPSPMSYSPLPPLVSLNDAVVVRPVTPPSPANSEGSVMVDVPNSPTPPKAPQRSINSWLSWRS